MAARRCRWRLGSMLPGRLPLERPRLSTRLLPARADVLERLAHPVGPGLRRVGRDVALRVLAEGLAPRGVVVEGADCVRERVRVARRGDQAVAIVLDQAAGRGAYCIAGDYRGSL